LTTTFAITTDRAIGPGHPVLIVAELSGNHNGELSRALELIHAAKACGADAVKLQTYTADTITMDADGPYFRIPEGPWVGMRLYDLYRQASTPWEWHDQLFAEARRAGLLCFSSPFDPSSVDFLEGLGCIAYKVASFEVVDVPLLERIAQCKKPVIVSTGMATLAEIERATTTLRQGGSPSLALLHCISAYPALPKDMHLRNIPLLANIFQCPVGLSDHTLTPTAAVAAVALGASVVEKHLCLRRGDGGPDSGFSLEPQEFAELVRSIRDAEQALTAPVAFGAGEAEAGNILLRKSLFAARDIALGHVLELADVRVIRPGHGLPPWTLPLVLGRIARQTIPRATPLDWKLFQ
jgi:pseudaminic acid synthase